MIAAPVSTHSSPVHVHPAPTMRLRTATASTVSVARPADNNQNATGPMLRTDWARTTSYPHSGVIHFAPRTV